MPEVGFVAEAAAAAPGPVIMPICNGYIPKPFREHASADRFAGEPEAVCDVLSAPGRVVLVGLGGDAVAAGAAAMSRLLRAEQVTIDASLLPARQAAGLAAGACLRAWHFSRLRTRPDETTPRLARLTVVSEDPETRAAWQEMSGWVEAVRFARDLVAEPSNTLTPQAFVGRLAPLAEAGVGIEVLDAAALRRLGFGGLVAVGSGSANPPCLAVLRWTGTQGGAPVAFVGKGVTFDTGGICIKPADRMWDMRADMAGAAACAGAMLALARRRSPAPAMALLPLAENATGADSYRPGDVLRLLSGHTVEVIDTDAEGRLILADALAYAIRLGAGAIIDAATLTGSIVVALGHQRAGLFGNEEALATALLAAGEATGELLWQMPIAETHRRALDSDIADLKQCVSDRMQPDASLAAAFLREIVGDTPWAHLDIAGVESREEPSDRFAKGATGFGVRLLDRLVADRFETGRHG
jgi:leucyl aminopeptidase